MWGKAKKERVCGLAQGRRRRRRREGQKHVRVGVGDLVREGAGDDIVDEATVVCEGSEGKGWRDVSVEF